MAFKTKTKTRHIVDDRQTIDAKHNNILQSFTENKTNIVDLQNELNNINLIIKDLNIENAKSPILNMPLQTKIWHFDDKKKILEDVINRINNNIDENNYMLKTGKLISNYYKIINDEKQNTLISVSSNIKGKCKSKCKDKEDNTRSNTNIDIHITNTNIEVKKKRNIVDWFKSYEIQNNSSNNINNNTETNNIETNNTETNNIETNNTESNNINTNNITINDININNINNITINDINNDINNEMNNEMNNDILHNKDIIYDKYMQLIDKNYINNDKTYLYDAFDMCNTCNVEMLLNNNTGQLICPKCGIIENIIIDSDKPSFKEPPKEMTSFCYKRINHLNEFLAQFQAKETTDIPESVYSEILNEIKKERITNMAVITPEKMRILLKKIKKNDYYEHIPYIINQLNGLPAPVIAQEIEEIIRGMIKAIQIPFEKYCPQKRKNFLSYNYVMYKFFELLELDEYLNCFQLLKSRTKLHQQDEIWKNICTDLNWEYIKSL